MNVRENLRNQIAFCNKAVDSKAIFDNLTRLQEKIVQAKAANADLADEELNLLITQANEIVLPALRKVIIRMGAKEAHKLSVECACPPDIQQFLLKERAKAFVAKRKVNIAFKYCFEANVSTEMKIELAKVLLTHYTNKLGTINNDIKKVVIALVEVIGITEGRKIISSSLALKNMLSEVDRHFANSEIVRMLNNLGNRIATCSDSKSSTTMDEFKSDLVELCNDLSTVREIKTTDPIVADIKTLVTEAVRVISVRTLQVADNLKLITDKSHNSGYVENKSKELESKVIQPFIQTDPMVHAANSSARHQKAVSDVLQILDNEKEDRIHIIKTATRAVMETDRKAAFETIHQVIRRASAENAYDICVSYPDTNKNDSMAKLVYADALLFTSATPEQHNYYHELVSYNEHKQRNKVQPKIENLVDIVAKTNPTKVFGLSQQDPLFAKAILKSKNMLNWLLIPTPKESELITLISIVLNENRDLTDILDTFSRWKIAHFNSALKSTLSPDHTRVLRWSMLCRNDIVTSLSPSVLESHITLLMLNLKEMSAEKIACLNKRVRMKILRKLTSLDSIQTLDKVLALTDGLNFADLRKSKYNLAILMARFPRETIEYLKSKPASVNYKESACIILNQLHKGFLKKPQANELHKFLDSAMSPNLYDLVDLGIYQADATYSLNEPSLNLQSNPFVINTIVSDLQKPFVAPMSRNFYKSATPLAFVFVLNNETILQQLNSDQLIKLAHTAVEKDLSANHFELVGKIFGKDAALLTDLLKKSENYQSPSFWPSKATLVAMFVGAAAGAALALTGLRKYIPHILLGIAATGVSFGIGATAGLVILGIIGGVIAGAVAIWLVRKTATLITTGAKTFWNYIRGKSPEAIQEKADHYILLNALKFTPTEDLRSMFFDINNVKLQDYLYSTMKKYKDKGWKLKGIPKPTQALIVSIARYKESQSQKETSWFYRSIAFPIANLIWSIEKKYHNELQVAAAALGIASQVGMGNLGLTPNSSVMKGVTQAQIQILIEQPGEAKRVSGSAYEHQPTIVRDWNSAEEKDSPANPFEYVPIRRLSFIEDTRPTVVRKPSDKGAYSEPCDWSGEEKVSDRFRKA